jgi:hypothetical protein
MLSALCSSTLQKSNICFQMSMPTPFQVAAFPSIFKMQRKTEDDLSQAY